MIYASIARARFGAHHLLDLEPNRIFAITRSPIGGARLLNSNLARSVLRAASGWWSWRSCPHPCRSLQKDFPCRIGQKSQNQLNEDRKRQRSSPFWLAKRLWSFLCKPIGQGVSHFLYCEPRTPPSQNDISGRAPIIAEKTWHRLR